MTDGDQLEEAAVAPELRVLTGRLAGSRCALQPDRPTTVGAGPENDIVLPATDIGPCRLILEPHGAGLMVRVLAGEVNAGGQRWLAGSQQPMACGVPLQMGQATVAVAARPGFCGSAAQCASSPAAWPRRAGVAVGVVSCALSVGGLALGSSAPGQTVDARRAAAGLEAAYHDAGLEALRVQATADQGLRVTGYLETDAQRATAASMLSRQALPGRLDVWNNGSLSAAVQEVFGAHHVPAQAVVTGPGRVIVHTQHADEQRLQHILVRVRQDVPGLQALELRNTLPTVPVPLAPDSLDPGKRIASIVPGEAAYVVTADGTRYFEGALLPTGQRVAAIRPGDVRLERQAATVAPTF
jgi:type III secretion protein D